MAWYIQTVPRSSDEASPALSPCASIAVGPDCLQVSMYNQPRNHAFSSTGLCFLVFGMFSLLFAKAVYPHSVFFPSTSACNQTTNWSTPVQPLTCSTTASVNQSHALTCPALLNLYYFLIYIWKLKLTYQCHLGRGLCFIHLYP